MNTHDLDAPVLPEFTDERVAAIERDVFARIADDRRRQRRRRTLAWSVGGAAAAVLVVAAVIAPGLMASLSGGADSYSVAPATDSGGSESAAADRATVGEAAVGESVRAVISTASATVVVEDVATAAQRIADDAEARGGYVESLSVDAAAEGITGGAPVDGLRFDTDQVLIEPAPGPGSGAGRVTVRIPDEDLDAAIAALAEVGEVTSSTVSRQDVTDQAIDLRARVAAGEASVARLTELLAQAADVADLIAAETALAERQAALESDRQQLAWLEGQVDLSTLTVQLVPRSTPVEADPAGFTDGVMAGWNGLVAAANGVVIAVGFLLPWLAVAAGAGAVVWGIVRLIRRSRRVRGGRRSPGDAPPAP
ncbi:MULTISPECIES: DUF4349 domain-containing protein [Microbacterium]|uniref:DUF4349 domain-containing protein n=1 Tax=Microbacterium wangchenii TaxID=2541726 RepID=A0ABX5SW67_9MICO|nr:MULTISPECIES: DUF4349 domain-containing protein [Microbacterium]MCK6065650.1 DUF4349 domain-containing protein [Microbacterium sp. EYE_512]QBR89064.1 DUF4349 domain-containing protein [Microbacterium wangchenii]TFV81853.1 DUF4349 domain-containing protein [Microbacterium sp. dk485]TXK20784.1 DUF4349 domain-containing protein [Microbacterium wangchenii]